MFWVVAGAMLGGCQGVPLWFMGYSKGVGCKGVAIVKLFEMVSVYCHAVAMLGGC